MMDVALNNLQAEMKTVRNAEGTMCCIYINFLLLYSFLTLIFLMERKSERGNVCDLRRLAFKH